jgi:capsular exopolysaccharide synthesis family protein
VLQRETLGSRFAEAYRALRANISFRGAEQAFQSIMVTSAAQGEGKTVTVVNLGIIMAQADLRVVVVDADLRQSSMQDAMSELGAWTAAEASTRGLTDVLIGTADIDSVLVTTRYENLFVVPAGPKPPNPSELLSSERMRQMLADLGDVADCVLIDTPPCLLYSDALLLSQMVDGVLYVVRSGTQDRAGQKRVQQQLQQAKSRVLGVVFNEVEGTDAAHKIGYH